MTDLATTAPAFIEIAHRIVWCSVATVDSSDRPRSRVLHPFWEWDGTSMTGWIATGPTPVKLAHLERSPYVSCSYWAPTHDTAVAECRAEWAFDDESCKTVWEKFEHGPEPVGYDPAIIPVWSDGPTSEAFAVLKLAPWRLRVMPGTYMMTGGAEGELLTWSSDTE
jgi:hypothetical protein